MSERSALPQERSPEAKRAYTQGYKTGWELALKHIRRGATPQQVEDACFDLHQIMLGTLEADER